MSMLLCSREGAVKIITFNRPEKLNALSSEMRSELFAEMRNANEDDSVRVVLLTGSGRGFCVGADLSSAAGDLKNELRESFHPLLKEIRFGRKIFICAVSGVAAGAGLSLAVACDMRFSSPDARFVTAFHRIGLAPDTGLSFMLPRLIPAAAAFELLLRGGEFSAKQAVSWSLFSASDNPLSDALKAAHEISAGPFLSFVKSKQLLNATLFTGMEQFLDIEAEVQGELGLTQDFAEGRAAFVEKRKAEFTGR